MTKKIFTFSLVAAICAMSFFACRKEKKSTGDLTLNYFPLQFGKYVTYDVDSTYYIDSNCTRVLIKSQMKYAVTDTFTDKKKRKSYIMDVWTRPYDGAAWKPSRVIILTPAQTPILNTADPITTDLLYFQDNAQYVKMRFPVEDGVTWKGNKYVTVQDSLYSYLRDWDYTYKNTHMSFNNGRVNFDNTVTVIERALNVNDPYVDSAVNASSTYAKEVYAYNVGMIYREWTHTTYKADTSKCLRGYRVVMRAVDYN